MSDAPNFCELTRDEAVDILCRGHKYLILFHVHPDGDCIGSAFALRSFIAESGREAYCVCADEVPERLLFACSDVQRSVILSSLPSDFEPDTVVSVDTASPAQLGDLYDTYKDKIHMMIDHHGKGTPYAPYFVRSDASACGEILYDLIFEAANRCGMKISHRTKELLYTAISSDTGCFRYNNVTPRSFNIAAKLLEDGIDTSDINHKLFGIKTLKQMQVEHAGFERMNFYAGGRIAVITFPHSLKTQYGATDENLETLIDVARSVKGVEVAAVVKQFGEENRFRVSMRSCTDFDVSEICALYGGGGHARAAGCTLNCDSILTAEMTIVSVVEMRFADSENEEE